MRRCNGHCKGPHTDEFVIESLYDPRWGPRVVLHDRQRCTDDTLLLRERLRTLRRR